MFPVIDNLRANIINPVGVTLQAGQHGARHDESSDGLRELRDDAIASQQRRALNSGKLGTVGRQLAQMNVQRFLDDITAISKQEVLTDYVYDAYVTGDGHTELARRATEVRGISLRDGYVYGPLFGTEAVITLDSKTIPSAVQRALVFGLDDAPRSDELAADPVYGHGGGIDADSFDISSPMLWDSESYGQQGGMYMSAATNNYIQAENPLWGHVGNSPGDVANAPSVVDNVKMHSGFAKTAKFYNEENRLISSTKNLFTYDQTVGRHEGATVDVTTGLQNGPFGDDGKVFSVTWPADDEVNRYMRVTRGMQELPPGDYTFSCWVKGSPADDVRLYVRDFEANSGGVKQGRVDINGEWTRYSNTVTATAGNSIEVFLYSFADAAGGTKDAPSGEPMYFWGLQLEAGSVPTDYTTPTQNHGDIDIRALVTPDRIKPASRQCFASKWRSGNSWFFGVQPSGEPNLILRTSDEQNVSSVGNPPPFKDGDTFWLRGTVELDNGSGNSVFRHYYSADGETWIDNGVSLLAVVSPSLEFGDILIGSYGSLQDPWGGDISYVEVRSGIDGDTYFTFNADEWAEGATSSTNELGQLAAIQLGSTEIVRNSTAWLPALAGNSVHANARNIAPTTLLHVDASTFTGGVEELYDEGGWQNLPFTRVFSDGSDTRARIQTGYYSVSGGRTYTLGLRVRPGPGVAADRFVNRMQFQTNSGTSNLTENIIYSTAPVEDGWYEIKSTFVAPEDATAFRFYGDHQATGTQNVGQYVDVAALFWAEGAGKSYDRPVRFPDAGTVVLRGKITPDILGAAQSIVTLIERENIYTLNLSTNSDLVGLQKSEAGADMVYGFATADIETAVPVWLEASYDRDTNIATFRKSYDGLSWIDLGTDEVSVARSGTPYEWGYGGRTDVLPATSSAPQLFDFRRLGVSKLYRQAAANLNNITTEAPNMLRSIDSHLQGTAGTQPGNIAVRAEYTSIGLTDEVGGFHAGTNLALKAVGNSSSGIRQIFNLGLSGTGGIQVEPSTTYTIKAAFYSPTAGQKMELRTVGYDAGGVAVGGLTNVPGSNTTLTQNAWTVVTGTFTTSATTEYLSIDLPVGTGDAFSDGEVMYLGALGIYPGTYTGALTPSIRSHKEIDIRTRLALKQYVGGGTHELASRWYSDPNFVWLLRINNNGKINFYRSTDGTNSNYDVFAGTVALSTPPGDPIWIRATYTADSGGGLSEVRTYTSDNGVTWTLLEAIAGPAAPELTPEHTNPLTTAGGASAAQGAILAIELRDGIDGTVVASFKPTDHVAADTWLDRQQNEWAIQRSGSNTSEFMESSSLLFAGDQIVKLADRVDWDIAAGQDYWQAGKTKSRSDANGSIFGGYDSPTNGVYMAYTPTGGKLRIWERKADGVAQNLSSNEVWNDGAAKTFVLGREGTTAYVQTPVGTVTSSWVSDPLVAGPDGVAMGAYPYNAAYYNGAVYWHALGKGKLSSAQKAELAAWNGSVADEPSWLRAACTFYWNADDEWAAACYRNSNNFVNLAGMYPVHVGSIGTAWNFRGSVSVAGVYTPEGDKQAVLETANWRGAASYTDRYGRPWELAATTDASTPFGRVLDRSSAVFGPDDVLTLPNRSELNPNLSGFSLAFGGIVSNVAGRVIDKRGAEGYGLNVNSNNRLEVNFDTAAHAHNAGVDFPDMKLYEPITAIATWTRNGSKIGYVNGVSGLSQQISEHSAVNITNTSAYKLGSNSTMLQWNAYFNRVLNTGELSELAYWTGEVATEPTWLRSSAVFYWNLDDQRALRALVDHGVLVNLAVQPNGVYEPFVSGDLDLRFKVAMKNWDATRFVIAHWDGPSNERSYIAGINSDGQGRLYYTADPLGTSSFVSGTPVQPPAHEARWMRITADASTGPDTYITFYDSDDGVEWTQNGDVVTISGQVARWQSAAGISLGTHSTSSSGWNGLLLHAEARAGIDGPVSFRFNPENIEYGQQEYVDSTGMLWGLNTTPNSHNFATDRPALLLNSAVGSRLTVPDRAEFQYDTENVWMAAGFTTQSTGQKFLLKRGEFGGTNEGLSLVVNGAASFVAKGENNITVSSATNANDSLYHSAVGVREPDTLYMYMDGDVTTADAASAGSTNRALPLYVGSPNNISQAFDGEIMWVAYGAAAITAAQATELSAWSGMLHDEPNWLRADAAFYWNAADPAARDAYRQTNDVLNLAVREFYVTYEVSLDGGVTWQQVENGIPADLVDSGTDFTVRAKITRPETYGPVGRIYALAGMAG